MNIKKTKISKGILIGTAILTLTAITTNFPKAGNILSKNIKIEKKGTIDKEILVINKIKQLPIIKKARLNPYKVVETNGIYYVMLKTQQGQIANVYLTKDLQLMIHSGQGISTKTGVPYNPPVDINSFKGKESFTYGNGKEIIYVFTDPECPFCQKFEKKWNNLKDKYTMKVFIIPLSYHKKAPEMSHWVLSAKTDEEKSKRLLDISEGSQNYKGFMKTETVAKYKEIEKQINKTKDLASLNSITGTPTVLDANGNSLNWKLLK